MTDCTPAVVVTVTVAVAEACPVLFEATAVYVVVALGLTDVVPPPAARLYVLPSDPVTVTVVAFVAVTVSVEAVPAVIEVGEAVILTVGPGAAAVTVTVAVAEACPLLLDATAVYVAVALGLTDVVPPPAARLYVLPSDPVTVTLVALVAATVSVEALPAVIEVGEAAILTVGAGDWL